MPELDYTQITFIKRRHFTKKRKTESQPRKYTYISTEAKNLFLNLFLFQSCKIQDAAKQAGIKYSSAKTILFMHRKLFKDGLIKDKIAAINCPTQNCGYRKIEPAEIIQMKVVSRIGCQQ